MSDKSDKMKGPGLSSTGNRVLLGVAAGIGVYVFSRSEALALVAAVAVFLLATIANRLGPRP
jgi:hypothetical protein